QFAVEHPGICVLDQGNAGLFAGRDGGMRLCQGLFEQQAIGRHGITFERSFGMPQVNVTRTQAAQRHGVALGRAGRLEVAVFCGLLGHGIATGNNEDLRLAGRAGGHRTRQVFVAELT
ncbi:hypothetical protein CN998_33115, partial [Bacillus cereus]